MKIFISYTSSDKAWAHWLGWNLKNAGHEPFVHEWEIGAGENVAQWMEERIGQAERLIGLFSDAYIQAAYSQSERWAAYWDDPTGRKGFLVPIEVQKVREWPRLVKPLKRLSLVGLDEDSARTALLSFLAGPSAPVDEPDFPGRVAPADAPQGFSQGSQPLAAQPPAFPEPSRPVPPSPEPSTPAPSTPGPSTPKLPLPWRWGTWAFAAVALVVAGLAALWWFYPVRKGDYAVTVQYDGIDRSDIRAMMRMLRNDGWKMQGVDGGGDQEDGARGKNEVRYRDDERAAKLLAQQVTAHDLAAAPVEARKNPTIAPKALEVWISRPMAAPVLPPAAPRPAPSPLPSPSPAQPAAASPRFEIDQTTWDTTRPDRAYCFQRRNSPVTPGRTLARCFSNEQDCRRMQASDSGERTACAPTSGLLGSPLWRDSGNKGALNSWFKYGDREFPPPFPQFQ